MTTNDYLEEILDRVDEVFEVYYYSNERTGKILDSVIVEIPDFNRDRDGERALNFHVAPDDFFEFEDVPPDVKPIVGYDGGREQMAYVTDRIVLAIGIYLGYLETHAVAEDKAWSRIQEVLSDDTLDYYVDYVDGLSEMDRGREMMEQVEQKIEYLKMEGANSPFWAKTVRDGEWMEKGFEDDVEWLRDAVNSVDLDPRSCHYTVQGVFEEIGDYDDVEYCEGFAFQKWLGRTLRHAWIEIDGCVVEVTWPWHRFDGDAGMYYGVSIDKEVVMERMESRGRGTIALFNDSEYQMMNRIATNRSDISGYK